MKNPIRRYSLLALLFIMTIVSEYAQESSKVEKIVKKIGLKSGRRVGNPHTSQKIRLISGRGWHKASSGVFSQIKVCIFEDINESVIQFFMKSIIRLALIILLIASCQQFEIQEESEVITGPEFVAMAEGFDAQTKTDLDGNSIIWTSSDQLAIFQGSSVADMYRVKEDCVGKNTGTFEIVAKGESGSAIELETNVAFYPYNTGLTCTPMMSENGNVVSYQITGITIPSKQTYTSSSFADESFLMAAITNGIADRDLNFKNVCGVLRLHLKGTAKVKTVELRGNDNEPLSGNATLSVYPDGTMPAIIMASDASTTVTLDCGDGVKLNEDTATPFLITIPPTAFEKGFSVKVTSVDGGIDVCSTSKSNYVRRSYIHTMPDVTLELENGIKVLAIGNSFSDDALQYLYDILTDVGYDNVSIGHLTIGGSSLKTHAGHLASNNAAYNYRFNTSGKWESIASSEPYAVLDSEDWDYITMQQVSHYSGMADTYDPYLETMVNIVREHCPKSRLVWHMTWAYDQNSTHSGFDNYDNDQINMYTAILDVVKSRICTDGNFINVIPNGTTIQNLRTSFLADRLTRDGYHLSTDIGRYAAALTYAKALTGCDLTDVTYATCTRSELRAIKEAVNMAIATPYEVTVSTYPSEDDVREDFTDARWVRNRYVNPHNGLPAIGYTEGRCTMCEDYIPVEGGTTYNMTLDGLAKPIRWFAWYDSKKAFISGGNDEALDLIAPENAKYIRVTIYSDSGWYKRGSQVIDENGFLVEPAASRIKLVKKY